MPLHIFWDNSNIWGGAQDTRKIVEPEVPWYALRVYFKHITQLVEAGRPSATKVMAGSVPPECEDLWNYARCHGYNTDLLKTIDNGEGGQREQAVDEMLHLKISLALLQHKGENTLVLLTGDGATSEFGTSFPQLIELAISNGWKVELHTWSTCINKLKYSPISEKYPDTFAIKYLDPYYDALTFVKACEYYRKDSSGNKTYFTIPERVVRPL